MRTRWPGLIGVLARTGASNFSVRCQPCSQDAISCSLSVSSKRSKGCSWLFRYYHFVHLFLQVEQVRLLDRFSNKSVHGTLYLTATHLIFVESNSNNSASAGHEVWVSSFVPTMLPINAGFRVLAYGCHLCEYTVVQRHNWRIASAHRTFTSCCQFSINWWCSFTQTKCAL